MGIAADFKTFVMRGNVVDLAVGVVIGGAFGRIVSSAVDAILMPVIGLFTAGADFSTLALTLGTNAKGEPVLLRYGLFCQSVLNFLIIALVLFLALKAINRWQTPPAPAPAAAPAPSAEALLLSEIRDLLARR
jgi:large conductance mechanosensitive channel